MPSSNYVLGSPAASSMPTKSLLRVAGLRDTGVVLGTIDCELRERDLFLFVILSAALFVATVCTCGNWTQLIGHFGDNGAYLNVARAIKVWQFEQMPVQHFMGYSYLIAGVSLLFHVPISVALLLISWSASLISVFLVARLLGTWTAAYFALTNFAWLQRSLIGGSEPLALALGLGAFWSFRRGSMIAAALLGSLAVTVRPLMIFTLAGIGIVLLYRKQFRSLLAALATGLAVGALYMLPLGIYLKDPLLTVHTYTSRDYGAANVSGPHGHLFGWPFHGIVAGTIAYPPPFMNLVLSFFWISLVLLGVGAMFAPRFREYARAYPAEAIFCALYLAAVFCYDYLVWARGSFMRFAIPALPFLLYALLKWLPKDKRILWLLGTVSPILAACSALGVRNVLQLLHR
jgi:hypothetical protein